MSMPQMITKAMLNNLPTQSVVHALMGCRSDGDNYCGGTTHFHHAWLGIETPQDKVVSTPYPTRPKESIDKRAIKVRFACLHESTRS
jgi:hypothetical protein